jgi:uncharacterized membrane protein
MMDIGSLEYVVISFEDDHFTHEILPELNAIQEKGLIRVVDLLFVMKETDSTVTIQEVSELRDEELAAYDGIAEDIMGLFTAEDIEKLAEEIPPGTSAVVVLLEHTWATGLTEAVRRAGGMLLTGGLVTPDALTQVRAELAAAKEENDA